MTRKIIREFAQQFGKDWHCVCKAPFGAKSLDIVSESENSLVAHYVCPKCGREQMLAASISNERTVSDNLVLETASQLSADDVLDIRDEVRLMKQASIRSLQRSRQSRQKHNQPTS